MSEKTVSLEQELQELKEKAVSCKPYYSNMVKLSDVEDFVELYQKTRQTLRQQIKECLQKEEASLKLSEDMVIKIIKDHDSKMLTDDYQQIIQLAIDFDKWRIMRDLAREYLEKLEKLWGLLDRPNEDYIVIKRRQLQELFDTFEDVNLMHHSEIKQWVQDSKEELLGLPKKETTK